ncbi:MAG: bifunctional folylpolyglutamate synthase/dihydrofolate synthase [Candidatus Marinimicrobia bacterium]|nr:bifunctional folylpolyglutamate synthase/dihydrofolate synthase [Candidatus Neomarinimicrobiota bacterium]MCF7828848.1 bifunctional folylpolyglutamate synthase/dihydrofolate synthase [Candidatus Neomarinimicrobiota bacterium]MCF7880765.1 bifunctional folylpolyglutamate synthase/dihydrofolate synthase [Candidatus Neomarinimicrobiota bacterium]
MTNYQDTLRYLYNLKNRGIKLNLDRVLRFQEVLDFPDRSYPSFHIAGTNGKGSVAHFLAAMLQAGGNSVGLYTSPHLIRFNERIRINGTAIPDKNIVAFVRKWRDFIDENNLTYFETTTLLAMDYFRRQNVDVAVLETGLGGRLDATNIVTPLVSVITSIGLEHTEQLGSTLPEIAGEKAGIIKAKVPCVIGDIAPEAEQVIVKRASELEAPLWKVMDELDPGIIQISNRGETEFTITRDGQTEKICLALIGRQAAVNAAIALTALKAQDRFYLPWEKQKEALECVTIPGRMQQVSESPRMYYDVAHNYDGMNQLLTNLRILHPNSNFRFLMSLSELKDISDFNTIIPKENPVGIMTIDTMPMHPEDYWREALPEHEVINYGRNCEAVQHFRDDCSAEDIGVIAGSHYIAESVYRVFNFSLDS